MFESRQTTIPFPSHLNDYYCDEKKGSYGPQFLEANSYGASHIDNSIPQKEKDPGSFILPCYINNIFFDNSLADLGASLTVELADRTMKYPKGIAKNVLVRFGKFVLPVDFIILDIHEDVKVPLILERPFLSTAHTKIDVFKRKITLRVRDEKIIFKSMKPASSLIKRVYMLGLRERMELDLEARLMGETLMLNRSLDPLYGDYIKLNDFNVPLELRREQVDDLMPTIEEGEVIDEPMIDIIKTRKNESFDEEFYNSIMKDKVEYTGNNIVGAFMDVPIFVENFSVVTHFAVVKNMDGYRDQDMGDIIFGEPFCKASCVEARRFDGFITIHNGNDNVTYQMARSHPRFKHLSNAQCNKIKSLLKVFSVLNWALKPNQPEGPLFTAHMLDICNTYVPVAPKAPKTSSHSEKKVPQGKKPGAKSGLRRKSSSKHISESQTEASKSKADHLENKNLSSSVKDKSPSHPSARTHVVVEMHKESQQAAGGPTSLEATTSFTFHSEFTLGNDVLANSTVEADPRISAPNDSIPHP
ncbi:retrovirus-related pol polyprotein from transposon TNT 1-94 [Tanacetum coccineum]